MNAPDRNAIGSVIRFASPAPPSAVFATDPTSRPMARNASVPASTSGTAMYQAPFSCSPRNGSTEIADEQHQLDQRDAERHGDPGPDHRRRRDRRQPEPAQQLLLPPGDQRQRRAEHRADGDAVADHARRDELDRLQRLVLHLLRSAACTSAATR